MSDIIEYDALAEDLLGEDLLGDDELGYMDMLGANRRRRRRRMYPRDPRWQEELRRGAPGAPVTSEKMLPLGFGLIVFTNTSPTTVVAEIGPHVAFRLERIVASVRRVGTSAANIAVTVDDIKIGSNSQLAGSRALPIELFAAEVQDTRLACDPTVPGVPISVTVRVSSAPLTTDQILVSLGAIGRAVR